MFPPTTPPETDKDQVNPRRQARRAAFVPIALALVALLVSACTPAEDLGLHINYARGEVGAQGVSPHPTIENKAQAWAQHMADTGQLVHSDLRSGNNLRYKALGENIGNFPDDYTVDQMHQAFMNSPGHRDNLLNGRYNYVGIGIVHQNRRLWVVEEFMQL